MDSSPPSSSAPDATGKPSRQAWWFIVLPLLGLLILSFACWCFDEPPPNVSDLVFEPLNLPDERNAYAVLTKAALISPAPEWTSEEDEKLDAMFAGEDWDDALAHTCLANLAPAWPLLEEATRMQEGQTPWVTSYSDRLTELTPLNKKLGFAQIKALSEARSGNPDEGLNTALVMLAVGRRLEDSRGALMHYLTGVSASTFSLRTITWIVANHPPSREMLHRALDGVSASRIDSRALTLALYTELRPFESMLTQLRQNGIGALDGRKLSPWLQPISHIPIILKPNRTRRIYTDYLRRSVSLIDRPLDELKTNAFLSNFDQDHIRGRFPFSPDNILGRKFLEIVTPPTFGLLRTRLRNQSLISCTEAFLALHLYKCDHGEFPATLDTLVPAYLPAVPCDYIDGVPIRYSRELGVLWSVGDNNLNIIQPDQIIEDHETVLYLTPRPPHPKEPATGSFFGGH